MGRPSIVQFGRVHYLEGAAGSHRARIRNLRVGNVNAGNQSAVAKRMTISGLGDARPSSRKPQVALRDTRTTGEIKLRPTAALPPPAKQ